MKPILLGTIFFLEGCSGWQIGDSGGSGPGCDLREEALSDLSSLPPGWSAAVSCEGKTLCSGFQSAPLEARVFVVVARRL